MNKILGSDPSVRLPSDVLVPLADVVARLMAKDPAARPSTMAEVAGHLQSLQVDRGLPKTPLMVASDGDTDGDTDGASATGPPEAGAPSIDGWPDSDDPTTYRTDQEQRTTPTKPDDRDRFGADSLAPAPSAASEVSRGVRRRGALAPVALLGVTAAGLLATLVILNDPADQQFTSDAAGPTTSLGVPGSATEPTTPLIAETATSQPPSEVRPATDPEEPASGTVARSGIDPAAIVIKPDVILTGHQDWVLGVAFEPSGHRLVTTGNSEAILWDLTDGVMVDVPIEHPDGFFVERAAFSPDGEQFITTSDDGLIRRWDTDGPSLIGEPLAGHSGAVFGVAFTPGGDRFVTVGADATVRFWDAKTGEAAAEPLVGHRSAVYGVAISPDGSIVATASADTTFRFWDSATGSPLGETIQPFVQAAESLAFNRDGTLFAVGGWDGQIAVYSVEGRAEIAVFDAHIDYVKGLAFHPDTNLLVSVSQDGTVRLWDADRGEALGEPLVGHSDQVHQVAFSPLGDRMATTSIDGTVRLWAVSTAD